MLNYFGLAKRAGFLVSGQTVVERAIRKQKISMVIIANDASENTKKDFEDLIRERITIVNQFSSTEISQAIGQTRKILGISDPGITKQIKELLKEVTL
ncbi:50S ribosomal protein L7 [Oenococcus oeni S23]|uniref:50S ribosomal protein L7ae n=1 Tax=Oenococcus oeni TaxID=1247 RepID=A0AAJ2P204_OENOE|nr:50S ribosomal protein L7ae [Oenococcus oeni]KGH52973.1 50S ribosomal protein L7 [Oenococcus oeni S11]KGH56399.1 50S ribosomal protein L7 [Oenococcus oeni S22]KGH58316.1 50S ribosomal protein L7 [Oenococcus oeni IOEB_B10]KGH59160.1 50S ribosomal protein L7 [Oenococcus oeni IOEB_9805]KGH61020.1 50S ribosomal protein L7 [Oenococcus oeni S28]KGH61378.1 50S ribosomal protein L7 [Oenococcus oeni S13]KGH63482.1 50S ribosomal protein L7 [Oenococcus oeni IOEB_CiNe]KGH66158.1 50S ribosomal protein